MAASNILVYNGSLMGDINLYKNSGSVTLANGDYYDLPFIGLGITAFWTEPTNAGDKNNQSAYCFTSHLRIKRMGSDPTPSVYREPLPNNEQYAPVYTNVINDNTWSTNGYINIAGVPGSAEKNGTRIRNLTGVSVNLNWINIYKNAVFT